MPHHCITLLQVCQSVLLNLALSVVFNRHLQCAHVLVEIAHNILALVEVRIPQYFIDSCLGCPNLFLDVILLVGQLTDEHQIFDTVDSKYFGVIVFKPLRGLFVFFLLLLFSLVAVFLWF